jgi:hypothetical protein
MENTAYEGNLRSCELRIFNAFGLQWAPLSEFLTPCPDFQSLIRIATSVGVVATLQHDLKTLNLHHSSAFANEL